MSTPAAALEPAFEIGEVAALDHTLAPTAHPPVPSELSLVWLAPALDAPVGAGLRRLASGVRLFHEGRYTAALTPLSSRADLSRGAADYAAYYAAQANLKLGRLDLARRQFNALKARRPAGALAEAALLGEADAAEALGDFAGAVQLYEGALKLGPVSPDAVWTRLGRAARASGERSRAIDAYTRVYEAWPLGPHVAEALSALSAYGVLDPPAAGTRRFALESKRADSLFGAKRYDEARAIVERLQPHASGAERERLEVRLGVCLYHTGRHADARRALRPYVDRGPHRAEARLYDLMSARALGARAEFEARAVDFVETFPDSAWTEEALNALGSHYLQRDRVEEADAVFRRMVAAFPAGRFYERAAWKVGWRALRAGRAADAARVFERAAAQFPRSDYRPAYLYWAARARERTGDRDIAAERFELVRTDYLHSYYGRLADAALGRRESARASAVDVVPASSRVVDTASSAGAVPPAALITQLLLAGLHDDALNEIRVARHRGGDSAMLRATVAWVHHQQGELLAGARAARSAYPQYLTADGHALPSELGAVIFPIAYWRQIQEHAARHDLDPHIVAALMAQESGFVPDIRSRVNATGLMQLMPATAGRYARKLALPSYTPAHLVRPEVNLRLGTAYLADLMKEFRSAHLALAGYNAGERHVRRWMAERPDLEPDVFVDDIPFPETQNYVKKVLGAADNYRRIYGGGGRMASDPNRAIPALASRGR